MSATEHADMLITAAPCSAVLPAGAGKTELLARAATTAVGSGLSVLFLTHTNAGVAAFRRRLRKMGCSPAAVDARTISAFAERWCRTYPSIAGLSADTVATLTHTDYSAPAVRVLSSSAIQAVVDATWDLILVDEHQDADPQQHEVVVSLSRSVKTIVVGDPLQAVFNFAQSPTIAWPVVTTTFPPIELDPVAHRWSRTNPKLGAQLLEVRELLKARQPVDLRAYSEISWREDHPAAVPGQIKQLTQRQGTSVTIAKHRNQCVAIAKKAGGRLFALEDLRVATLAEAATQLDGAAASERLAIVAELASRSIAKLPSGLIQRLQDVVSGKAFKFQTASKLGPVTEAAQLAGKLGSPESLRATVRAIGDFEGIVIARRELWEGLGLVLAMAERPECDSFRQAFDVLSTARARDYERAADRVVATPLLVKGLEYDHVLVVGAHKLSSEELYVALTRGRSSVCVLSKHPVLAY